MTLFFLDQPLPGARRHVLYKVSRKNSKNWQRRTNIKPNLTPKIEYILQPSNYNAKPWFLYLTAQKSKCPRRFWELDHKILRTYLMCPCQAFYESGFFCSFFPFFAENVGSLKTQISPPKTKSRISDEKNKNDKNPFVKGSTGAHETRVQKLRV